MSAAALSRGSVRAAALADLQGLRSRHAAVFGSPWRQRRGGLLALAALLMLAVAAMIRLDFSLARIVNGLGRLGQFLLIMWPPSTGGHMADFITALGQTLAIAFLGTLIAALLAFPVALLAAKTVVPNPFVHVVSRRGLDVVRSVDTLIWALMWINVVGLGPFAGVLAIVCTDFGTFGKLFSEAIEATDGRAAEGVKASGGSRLHQIRFGLLPGVLPVLASLVLYTFESNTRSATIIGIVGAGGVGQYLSELIRLLELPQVLVLILMILATVAIIDVISTRLRLAMIGRRAP